MLASLNHPHIGTIYGVEQSEGGPALILELVEGPTLADRLAMGPIPLTESLGMPHRSLMPWMPRTSEGSSTAI